MPLSFLYKKFAPLSLAANTSILSDIYYRGRLDILNGNWGGFHRAYVLKNDIFEDIAKPPFDEPSRIRTVISADLDNDGYDEIFLNNIGEPNKLFRILENGLVKQIPLDIGLEPDGYGTGAAVADIDNDGILELLVSHGESRDQPLSLYKAKVNPEHKYLRIRPLNKYCLLYTSPSPRDLRRSRMPSSA